MTKRKKQETPQEEKPIKPYLIIAAKLRDSFCDYTFEIKKGTGIGDKHAVKGAGIVFGFILSNCWACNATIHLSRWQQESRMGS